MTDEAISRAAETLLFDPTMIDPQYDGMLWFCANAEDVYAQQANAVCLVSGKKIEDLRSCTEFINQFSYVFVAIGSQTEQKRVTEELRRVIVNKPIWIPGAAAFKGCSSLRELRDKYGLSALESIPMDAIEVPAYGLIDIADVEDPIRKRCANSGIAILDKAIGGFAEGELSVWTGKRGEGKSTLLSQILIEAINQGDRVFAYSGELPKAVFKAWSLLQAAGPQNITQVTDPDTGKLDYRVNEMVRRRIDDWWRGKFFLYDLEIASAHDENSVLSVMDYANLRYGCKVFLIDNAMTMRFRQTKDSDYYRAQSAFTGRLSEFAKRHSCHVHLVAHPRKSNSKDHLDGDDVGGSGDIVNRADNAFSVERVPEEKVEEVGFDSRLSILKNRQYGARGSFGLKFRADCRRFSGLDGILATKHYGWEQTEQTTFHEIPENTDMPF